jgi:hypothetical protein
MACAPQIISGAINNFVPPPSKAILSAAPKLIEVVAVAVRFPVCVRFAPKVICGAVKVVVPRSISPGLFDVSSFVVTEIEVPAFNSNVSRLTIGCSTVIVPKPRGAFTVITFARTVPAILTVEASVIVKASIAVIAPLISTVAA